MDGARANRIQEFRAEDLFLETELQPNREGFYSLPAAANGAACIGLQWFNERALRELALLFAEPTQVPATNGLRVEGWFGESAWQGNWQPLSGKFVRDGPRLDFQFPPADRAVQTRKIRWILPPGQESARVRLQAFTVSSWATMNLWVQLEQSRSGSRASLTIYNGEVAPGSDTPNPRSRISWNPSSPLRLAVRYSRPSDGKSDPTVLQFRLPAGRAAVAVEDVLANECVYLPDFGLFVAREPLPVTLEEYKSRIAGQKTVLAEVRAMPDQTFAQAMAKTHHEAQGDGPVLLSLACDNTKFVAERNGAVRQVVANATLTDHETQLEVRPSFGSGEPARLSRALDGGWLPIPVLTVAQANGPEYRQRTFVAPLEPPDSEPARASRRSVCVIEFTVSNTLPEPVEASLGLAFTDPRAGGTAAQLAPDARGWLVRNAHGVLARLVTAAAAQLTAAPHEQGLKVTGKLPAHGAAQVTLLLPAQPDTPLDSLDPAPLRAATEAYWRAMLSPATQIETPDPFLNNVIRSSQVRCLIAGRNEAGGARVSEWCSAMSYGCLESESHSPIRGMDFLGHAEFARRALDFFIHRYNPDGFLTTGYTTFGTAWHLWTLSEHYALSHDQEWLRRIAPEIARVGHWIVRQTDKTRKLDPRDRPVPEFGLLPPGVLADWNSFAYRFAMDAYYYAALRGLGESLADIDHPDAALFKGQAAELRHHTLRAYAWTQALSPAVPLRDGAWIPYYPSTVHSPGKLADFFPGQDAGRSWCYDVELGAHQLVPAGILDPRSREVERLMDHMEDVQFLSDGWFDYPATMNHADWFNLGGFSKVQPYYCRNAEIYALRDEVKPFLRSYFNTLAAMLNPEVLTLWEHFHHSGAWDKTHETGYFLYQTRTMLVQERGRDLWLAPFVTRHWLQNGSRLSVKQAPTGFGPVSFEVRSHVADNYIEAAIFPPARQAPAALVLRLRHPEGKPIRSVTIGGEATTAFDTRQETVSLKPAQPGPIALKVSY